MRPLGFVLLLGLIGSLSACGRQEGQLASSGQQPADREAQTDQDVDKGASIDDPKTKPDPKPEPQVDPPKVTLPTVDPTETTLPIPAPVVDPVPETLPPVVSPKTSDPVIIPDERNGDAKGDTPTTPGKEGATAKASGGRAINLSRNDSGKKVSAGVGDLVIVKLEAKPSTGFAWDSEPAADDAILKLKSKQFLLFSQLYPEMVPIPGEGGITTFTYRVVKTGKAAISLAYRRSEEKDAEPAKTFNVDIEAEKTTSPVVTGKIVFSEEPDVEKISRIVVSIRNTALADGPSPLVGTVELKPPFKLPVTFAVPYDPAKVRPNPMFYSISVRVNTVVDGSEKLYYINDTHHSVFRDAKDTKCDVAVKKIR